MYEQVEKPKENTSSATRSKSRAVANSVAQNRSSAGSTFQFVDNRPKNIAQRKLQEMANDSSQVNQPAQFQAMTDNCEKQYNYSPIQFRLQAKPSSWNPKFNTAPFFYAVQKSLNQLTGEGALNYQTAGKVYSTMSVNLGAQDVINAARLQHPNGINLITRLINSEKTTTIYPTNTTNEAKPVKPHFWSKDRTAMEAAGDSARGTNADVYWDSAQDPERTQVPVHDPNRSIGEQFIRQASPPQITLGHELIHADRFNRGVGNILDGEGRHARGGFTRNTNAAIKTDALPLEEIRTVGLNPGDIPAMGIQTPQNPDQNAITENDLRNEQQLATRVGYTPIVTDLALNADGTVAD